MKAVKFYLTLLVLAGLGAGVTTGAHAQAQPPSGTAPAAAPKPSAAAAPDTSKVVKPFSVKIGGLFPAKNETRDAIGNSVLTVGLGYDFAKTKQANPLIFQGYVDYFSPKSKTRNVLGSTFDTKLDYAFGVGAAARYNWNLRSGSQFTPYGLVGLGFYTIKGKTSGTELIAVSDSRQLTTTSFSDDSTKSGIGGKIAIGAELKMGFFGELEYDFIPKATPQGADVDISGFGARIGYRF